MFGQLSFLVFLSLYTKSYFISYQRKHNVSNFTQASWPITSAVQLFTCPKTLLTQLEHPRRCSLGCPWCFPDSWTWSNRENSINPASEDTEDPSFNGSSYTNARRACPHLTGRAAVFSRACAWLRSCRNQSADCNWCAPFLRTCSFLDWQGRQRESRQKIAHGMISFCRQSLCRMHTFLMVKLNSRVNQECLLIQDRRVKWNVSCISVTKLRLHGAV